MVGLPLVERVERHARDTPDRIAIITPNSISADYSSLNRQHLAWASSFKYLGVEGGDVCVLCCQEPIRHLAAALAVWHAGATLAIVDPGIKAHTFDRLVRLRGRALLITTADHFDQLQRTCRDINWSGPAQRANLMQVWATHAEEMSNANDYGEQHIVFTSSGSSGPPKLVAFSRAALLANLDDQVEAFELGMSDRVVTVGATTTPGYLTTALWTTIAAGATVRSLKPAPPSAMRKQIAASEPTVLYTVPDIYARLGRGVASRAPLDGGSGSLRLCLSSSATLAQEVFDEFDSAFGHWIRSIYCSVEAGSVTFNNSGERAAVRDTVGEPFPGVRLRIEKAGTECGDGSEGEILVSGSHVAIGYAAETRDTRDGSASWVRTGDAGFLRAGRLTVCGRLTDAVNIKGRLIHPGFTASVLRRHPDVLDAVVVGRADPRRGYSLHAQVVRADRRVTERQLIDFCAQWLDDVQRVRSITFVEDLDRNRDGEARLSNATPATSSGLPL